MSPCSRNDWAKGDASPSGWSSRSSEVNPAMACLLRRLGERLSHNADVGDARLFNRIHDRSKCAERYTLVGPQINDLAGWIGFRLMEDSGQLGQVDRLVSQKHILVAIDGQDQTLLRD